MDAPHGTRPFALQARVLAELPGLSHSFFTRIGGVSGGVYAALNCGWGSQDDRANVIENRARVAAMLGVDRHRLITLRQVHSALAVTLDDAVPQPSTIEADAVVTRARGLAVGVLTADCAPVLLADPEAGVIAAVHAGWRGAKDGIIGATVAAMCGIGADPARIRAAIGPAISVDAYEVGEDFRADFLAAHQSAEPHFRTAPGRPRPHFDLVGFVADQLAAQGIAKVEGSGQCTFAGESILFSYRRSRLRNEADYGRQISAIVLR